MGRYKRASAEEDQYIRDNYLKKPAAYISRDLGRPQMFALSRMRIMGLTVPQETLNKFRSIHAFQKGQPSQFKGMTMEERFTPEQLERIKASQFKKGTIPKNSRKNGDTILRDDSRGLKYVLVRVAGSKWRPLHNVNWESKYGKIPPGHVLHCKTDDRLNCDPDNWELITRKESMLRHSANDSLSDRYVADKIVKNNPSLKDEIVKNHPLIIDIKRKQILLNRQIKQYA